MVHLFRCPTYLRRAPALGQAPNLSFIREQSEAPCPGGTSSLQARDLTVVRKGRDLGIHASCGGHTGARLACLGSCGVATLGSGVTSGLSPGGGWGGRRGPGLRGGGGGEARPAGLWLRARAAAPPPLPPEADVEATARAAAGGGGAAAGRLQALAGPVAATAAAQQDAQAEEGGVPAARPRSQEEAMNGDRTESDWQGLVSEVRPRRRPGGMGRAERPPAPGPAPRVAEPGQGRAGGGRAPGGRGSLAPRDLPGALFLPRLPGYPGATFFHAIW